MLNTSTVREENPTKNSMAGFFHSFHVYELIFCLFTFLCSLCGLVGNGLVIWILPSCNKKNPLAIHIVNLAIANFGTLLSLSARVIMYIVRCPYDLVYELVDSFISFTYSASLYVLADLSVETCLSVLFPIWYRPRMSSAVVSFLLWVIPGLLFGVLWVLASHFSFNRYFLMEDAFFTIDLLIFTPIMVASSLVIFVKICWSSQRRHLPKVYTAVLDALLLFIVLMTLLSVLYFTMNSTGDFSDPRMDIYFFFVSVNSSINPIIYYFVGRKKKRQERESLKFALQRLFQDKTSFREGN